MTPILTLSQLTKRFGATKALSDVSLAVGAGERVALLGHNGAGKSTMMKVILGLIAQDEGKVSVEGHAPGTQQARDMTAYLPENVAFHPALTGREQISHYLRLRGDNAGKADDLLGRVGLGDAANRRIGTYSKGMRQRVGLAQALIGKPRLMVLDEPTSGLDPVSRLDFYSCLDDLAAHGTAILLSSHALTEVEARTDRIVILSGGRLVATGTLADLRSQAALPVMMHVLARPDAIAPVAEAFAGADQVGSKFTIACAQSDKRQVLARILALGDQVLDFEVLPPSLDDIYTHISKRDAA
jgi:Cu-processing system ATP-binding protein